MNLKIQDVPSRCLVKGTAIKNMKNFIVSRSSEAAFEQMAGEVGWSGKRLIVPSSWYSAIEYIKIQKLAAKELGMTDKQFGIDSGRYVLEEDLVGVYKFFMRMSGPRDVLAKLPQMSKTYLNFIDFELNENNAGQLKTTFKCPAGMAEWFCDGVEGAISGILNVCKKPMKTLKVIGKEHMVENGEQLASWQLEVSY